MSGSEVAELRARSFATQLAVSVCLAKICELMQQPNEFLDAIQKSAIPRVKDASGAYVPQAHRAAFEDVASHVLAQIAEGARELIANPKRTFDA